jgi:hypothetical protein
MLYWSSFTEPDGTMVEGFRPGYSVHSQAPDELNDQWAIAQLIDGPDFLFMPKFRWRSNDEYVVEVASEMFVSSRSGRPGRHGDCTLLPPLKGEEDD